MSVFKKLKTAGKPATTLLESISKITGNTPKTLVTETTVPKHLQHIPEYWSHHSEVDDATHEKISKAIPHGTHVSFPLSHGTSNPDPDVVEHLANHGWDVKDYRKGTATKKTLVGAPDRGIPMREKHVEKSIGSILDDTKAHEDVKKAFTNDPERSAARSFSKSVGGHHVVISTSPMAIAGMSTGTGWTSCMNLDGGINSHYLERDSANGTHVAYLVHHDDKEGLTHGTPSRPIARIALKAFHHEDDNGNRDTIFRPESNSYGSGGGEFHKAVHEWAVKNYPGKAGATYEKNSKLYDDDGVDTHRVIGKEEVDHAIDTNSPIIKRAQENLSHDLIDHAIGRVSGLLQGKTINHETGEIKATDSTDPHKAVSDVVRAQRAIHNIIPIPNLSGAHVIKLHDMIRNSMGKDLHSMVVSDLAHEHGEKFSSRMLNDHIAEVGGVNKVSNRALMNPKLSAEHVDQLRSDKLSLVQPQKIKEHHMDRVVDEYMHGGSGSFYNIRDLSKHLTAKHLDTLSTKPQTLTRAIINHPAFNQSHHDTLVKNAKDYGDIGTLMKESKFARHSDTEKFGDNLQWHGVKYLAENPHMHEDDGVKVKDAFMKIAKVDDKHMEIPKNVSDHMTRQDFSTLAGSGKSVGFADKFASNKHLDAIHEHIKAADSALSDHIEKEDHDFDDYPHSEDAKSEELQGKLHAHIESFAKNLDNHIDNHVEERGESTIKDHREHDNALNHIDKLNDLDHYRTQSNSSRYDGHEHYDDHVADVQERLDKIHRNTERMNDDW